MIPARRRALGTLALAPLLPAIAALAQTRRVARVGVLLTYRQDPYLADVKAGLRERGWVEGKTLALDVRDAGGDPEDGFPKAASAMVSAKPDVILAPTYLAVLAVTDLTETIPVVFAAITDPVKAGLVKSLARPGGQLTGVALGAAPLVGKRVELLKDAVPGLTRIAVLYDAARQGEAGVGEIREAAAALGMSIIEAGVSRAEEYDAAFADFRRRGAGAMVVPGTIRFYMERARIIALAARHRLPAIYEMHDFAEQGGLIAYGPNYPVGYRRAAYYIDRILRGAKPGELPIEEAMRYELVVNERAARAAGIRLSPALLVRADRVID